MYIRTEEKGKGRDERGMEEVSAKESMEEWKSRNEDESEKGNNKNEIFEIQE